MSNHYVNRQHDEDIIDIMRSVMDNGTGKAETYNEHLLIKLMQIRNTPIKNLAYVQARVDNAYKDWINRDQVHLIKGEEA